jgi:hypothetical protein
VICEQYARQLGYFHVDRSKDSGGKIREAAGFISLAAQSLRRPTHSLKTRRVCTTSRETEDGTECRQDVQRMDELGFFLNEGKGGMNMLLTKERCQSVHQ